MTRGLETLMNIPFLEEALKEKGLLPEDYKPEDGLETASDEEDDEDFEKTNDEELQKMLQKIEKNEKSEQLLAMIDGADHGEAMDKIHKETLKHAQNLVDLAYNVPENRMRGIFEQANAFYTRAIDSKNSKRKFQLDAMKLALEKRKLDLDEQRMKGNDDAIETGGFVEDRNALIRAKLEQIKKDKK